MKGSVQWSDMQSWAEFCFQWDSNPETHNLRLWVLTTRPPGHFYFLRCLGKVCQTVVFRIGQKFIVNHQFCKTNRSLTNNRLEEKILILILALFQVQFIAPNKMGNPHKTGSFLISPWKHVVGTDYFVCVGFYGPVNPMGPCRVQSVYLTTCLLGRLSPLSGLPVLCTFFCQKLTTALLE